MISIGNERLKLLADSILGVEIHSFLPIFQIIKVIVAILRVKARSGALGGSVLDS
jgi:hypothetical protein